MIDEMWEDMHGMSSIPEEVIQSWINEAVQRLGELSVIEGHFAIALKANLDTYPVTDGVEITALTTSDPGLPYVRATLASDVIGTMYTPVWVEDTNVIDGFQYAMNDSNAPAGKIALLEYPFSTVTAVAFSGGNIVITMDTSLGLSTGDYVAIAFDDVNVYGIYPIANVVDSTDYQIDGIASFDFTTGRIFACRKDSLTAYASVGGGRLWRGDQMPSYMSELKKSRRVWSNIVNKIDPVPMDNLIESEYIDTRQFKVYTDYTTPQMMATGNEGGQRYVRFYPCPISDSIAEIFCTTIYSGSLYNYLPLNHIIKIGRGYEDAVKEYCFFRYYKQNKDDKEAARHYALFEGFSQLRERVLPGKVRQTVTFR